MSEKKSRSPNFTSNERVLLLYLLEEYVSIIENKKTDAVTSKQKEAAWKSLADDFNKNTTCVQRSSEQLKIYYENYKRRVKKATADDKVELYKTGGGTFTKQLDDEGAKLMALLKPQFVPLVNLSDSDAGYHIELPGEEQVEKSTYRDPFRARFILLHLLMSAHYWLYLAFSNNDKQSGAACKIGPYCNPSSKPDRDLNPNLLVIGSLVHCESSALDHVAPEGVGTRSRTGIAITSGGLRRTRSIPPTLVLLSAPLNVTPLALSRASIKPILWDDGLEGERRGMASQPTKVFLHANKNRWITETVDGARYRTGLAEKLYV
uniref:Regulatory protein zeste n=1 Tax=Timema tahoe TaxID=61484 RepID=A0A7R9IM12_9NEOP|nr:unnamed protein product [Timema tahoe]